MAPCTIILAAAALMFKAAPSGVKPGRYTNMVGSVDSRGRLTDAENGRALPFVNAMDFGPSGTGSTSDDTAELQAAINATQDGGELYIPGGRYLVSSPLTVSKSIRIVGDGAASAIYLAPWFPTNSDALKFSSSSPQSFVQLERFAVYPHPGYSGEKPGRHAISFDCSGSSGWTNVVIRSMYVEARNGAAIYVDNSDGDSVTATGFSVENSVLYGGVQAIGVGNAFRVRDNTISYSANGNANASGGISVTCIPSASDPVIEGNFVSAFGGISVSGTAPRVLWNSLRDCGVTNTITTNRIWVGASTNAEIRGNSVDTMLSAATFYGVHVSSGAVASRIGPNRFPSLLWTGGLASNTVRDLGAGTVIEVDSASSSNALHSIALDRISTNGASTGSVLKFNGADYAPGTDNSGGAGSMLGDGLNAFTNLNSSSHIRVAVSGGSASLLISNTPVTAGTYSGLITMTTDAQGRLTSVSGSVNASALTNVNGSEIRSGTISNARLDPDLAALGDGTAMPTALSNAVSVGAPTLYAGSTNVLALVTSKAPSADPIFTGSLQLPNSDNPTVDATGEIAYDTDGWLRLYDGAIQVAIARKIVQFDVTVYKPNSLDAAQRDAFWVWSNQSGMDFVVTGWAAWSTADNTDFAIKTMTGSGGSVTTVDAVSITSDGTSIYYATDTTITSPTIPTGNILYLDFDDTDAPSQVKITIYGYFNANVN